MTPLFKTFSTKRILQPALLLIILVAPLDLCCQQSKKVDQAFSVAGSTHLNEEIEYWHISSGERDFFAVAQHALKIFEKDNTRNFELSPGHSKIEFSADASFFCQSGSQNDDSTETRISSFEVFSYQGDMRYRVLLKRHFDQPMQDVLVLSGHGGLVIGNAAMGRLLFYDGNGRLINEMNLFPEAGYDLERVLTLAETSEPAGIIAMATRRSASPVDSGVEFVSGEPTVFSFDSIGQEKWRKRLPQNAASELAVSDDGRFVLAATYSVDSNGALSRVTSLLNGRGEVMMTFDFLFRVADFYQGRFLIMADRAEAGIFQLPSGKRLGRFRINRSQGMITAVRIGAAFGRAAVLTAREEFVEDTFQFSNSKLFVLDQTGKIMQQIPFEDRVFSEPALYLSPDGNRISIGFRHDLLILEAGL